MGTLAFDIETVEDTQALDEAQLAYLDQRPSYQECGSRDGWIERKGALDPRHARVIVIGWWDLERGHIGAWYEGAPGSASTHEDGCVLIPQTEQGMLREFWSKVYSANRVLTWNGHWFDVTFLRERSLYHDIPRSFRTDSKKWYDRGFHIDLAEEMTERGKLPKYPLDFTCRRFGIPTPKTDMHGSQVGAAYKRGEILRIARYCVRDVRALGQLWNRVSPRLFENSR